MRIRIQLITLMRIRIQFITLIRMRIRIRNYNTAKKYQNFTKKSTLVPTFFSKKGLRTWMSSRATRPPDSWSKRLLWFLSLICRVMIEHNDLMLQLGLTPVVKYLLSQFGPGLVGCHRMIEYTSHKNWPGCRLYQTAQIQFIRFSSFFVCYSVSVSLSALLWGPLSLHFFAGRFW